MIAAGLLGLERCLLLIVWHQHLAAMQLTYF